MRKDVQGLILLLLGGVLLRISISGAYARYIKPRLLPLVVISGLVLVVVAVTALWPGRAPKPGEDEAPGELEPDPEPGAAAHGHDHGSQVGWLLVVPALVVLALAPPALGSYQAGRSGTTVPLAAVADLEPLPDTDPAPISVIDYAVRAVYDEGRSLSGRTVLMSGFIVAGPDATYLARMLVTCCAADARPVKVGLAGSLPIQLPPDTWVEVEGRYTDRMDHDPVNGQPIPYVEVLALRTIPAPEAGYAS